MKNFVKQNKEKIILFLGIILLGIVFFSYNITITWDSSEYLGLADYIGTQGMKENWIKHRGIAFPFLLKLLKPFGIENKYFILTGMFIFYIGMIFTIYKIYQNLNEAGTLKNKIVKYSFIIYTILFIILNPIIFGYYHVVLTEFVAMTISLVTCYLSWKWIENNWNENKENTIIYAVLFSTLTIFLYHIKQSLVVLTLIPIIASAIISIINNFKIKNILTKVGTVITVIITLLFSVLIWNYSMKEVNVAESTNDLRVKNRLIVGVNTLKKISDEETIENIDRSKINDKDNKEIDKVLNNESKYNKFKIYESQTNKKYLVYFTVEDGSFKEQLKFYTKILIRSPGDVLKSYYKNYYNIIFIEENYDLWKAKENTIIPNMIYLPFENVVDLNIEYEQYIENYREINHKNLISNIFNKYVAKVIKINMIITKVSLWVVPVMGLITFIIYLIVNKKIDKEKVKVIQLVNILYATSFGGIMAYIIFGTTVDRYVVPMIIPAFIAHFLFVIIIKYFIEYLKRNYAEKEKANKNY